MDCKSCVSCLNNEIPDAHQISCIKCNEGISQIINGKYIYVQNVLILLIMKMKNVN